MNPNHTTKRGYYVIAATLFLAVGVLHAVRAIMELPMNVGEFSLPVWPSWIVFVLLTYLAIRGYQRAGEMRRSR